MRLPGEADEQGRYVLRALARLKVLLDIGQAFRRKLVEGSGSVVVEAEAMSIRLQIHVTSVGLGFRSGNSGW